MTNRSFSTAPVALRLTRLSWQDMTIFLLGLGSFFHINFVGEVYPTEIALLPLFITLLASRARFLSARPIPLILLMFGIWLFAQVTTDLYRGTPTKDLLRGWVAIAVFVLDFTTIYMLAAEQPKRVYLLLFGYALGWLVQPIVQPYSVFGEEPWKFGYGYPATLLVFSWIGWRCGADVRQMRRYVPALLLLGLFSIYMNARSLGGMTILSAAFIWFRGSRFGDRLRWHATPSRVLVAVAVLGLVIFGVKQSYSYAAEQGWLGEYARLKYKMQATGELGLLLGGRIELIPALYAVKDSPIIGHGSWAKGAKYRDHLLLLLDLGYGENRGALTANILASDRIPAHSHVLQAWVWAGILGAVFWLVILRWVVKIFWHTFRYPTLLFAPLVFLAPLSIWDIFFSPFGSMTRFAWAVKLTVLLVSWRWLQQQGALRRQATARGTA